MGGRRSKLGGGSVRAPGPRQAVDARASGSDGTFEDFADGRREGVAWPGTHGEHQRSRGRGKAGFRRRGLKAYSVMMLAGQVTFEARKYYLPTVLHVPFFLCAEEFFIFQQSERLCWSGDVRFRDAKRMTDA